MAIPIDQIASGVSVNNVDSEPISHCEKVCFWTAGDPHICANEYAFACR